MQTQPIRSARLRGAGRQEGRRTLRSHAGERRLAALAVLSALLLGAPAMAQQSTGQKTGEPPRP